jgi:hypothetical protein
MQDACLVSKHVFFSIVSAQRSKVAPFFKIVRGSERKTDQLRSRAFRSDHLVDAGLII